MNQTLICDIEANGLLDSATTIHCLVVQDYITGKMYTFHDNPQLDCDGDLLDGVSMLQTADTIIFHNGIGYDIPMLKKFYPGFTYKKLHDTFILSQMFFPNEMERHGLEAWGKVFGVPKPKHEDWTTLSTEMLHRCQMDVRITSTLWEKCDHEIQSHPWDNAIQLEYDTYQTYCKHMTHWYIDIVKLDECITWLTNRKEELTARLIDLAPLQVVRYENQVKAFTAKGVPTARASNWDTNIAGDFCKVEFKKINLNSTTQLVEWLTSMGWQPDTWNYKLNKHGKPIKDGNGELVKTSPSLRDSRFIGVPEHIRESIIARNEVKHRLGVLEGWKRMLRNGNEIETFALTCGTNTARFRHRGVVNVPKAEENVFYGKEMRSLFIAPEGYTLVGCDASQLEARIEGHFSYRYDGGEYAQFLLNEDIHSFNAKSWGITRSEAKGPGYALAYQCGPSKIQDLLKCSEEQAKYIHKKYWEDRPALQALISDLEKSVLSRNQAEKKHNRVTLIERTKPWIRGIDGRKLYVRSVHSLKNTLIQNAGMVAMKHAFVLLGKWIEEGNLDARIAMVMHDEFQVIVKNEEKLIKQLQSLAERAILEGGAKLNLKVPLKGESKVGDSWGTTH